MRNILNILSGIALVVCLIQAIVAGNGSAIMGWLCAIIWFANAMLEEYL